MSVFLENLKEFVAAVEATEAGKPIQKQIGGVWTDVSGQIFWREELQNLRCLRPKPEPIVVPWSKLEHVPGPVCWIRYKLEDRVYLVTSIHSAGLTLADQIGADWSHMDKFEHSTDRVNWFPCTVTP